MAFGNLQNALIVIGVVILLIPIARVFVGDKIVEAADYAGLPFGKPRFGAFSAVPKTVAGETNMKFDASLGGSMENVELNIYEAYSKYPDAEPGQLYDNAVFSTGTGSGKPKLTDLLKGGKVLSKKCPADGVAEGCAEEIGDKPIESYDKRPGWYKFTASLTPLAGKSKKSFDEKEAMVGLYTEGYVELLDKPIAGCDDDWGNCNVVQCKKGIVNYNLAGGAQGGLSTWLGVRKQLVLEISAGFKGQDFVKLFGKPLSPGCGDFSEGAVRLFKADACTPQELDLLNRMIARARLLEIAYNERPEIATEDQYVKYLDRLDSWKKTAVDYTMSCTVPLNRPITTDPKGAYSEFEKTGWYRVPETGGFDEWKTKVKVELDNVLSDIKPGIASIKADAFDDRHLGLSWKIPVGENMVKAGSYKISQFHTKWAGKLTIENQKAEVEDSPFVLPGKIDGDNVRTSFDTKAGQLTGKHEFEVRIFERPDALVVFDDAYIETYEGVYGSCITEGLGKDPLGLYECNVVAQKRDELKSNPNPDGCGPKSGKCAKVEAAYQKADIRSVNCKHNSGLLSDPLPGCTPKEVDMVWKNYLIEIGEADDYNCVMPLSSEAKNVCIVKRQTVITLKTISGELFLAKVATGLFDDAYIETYKGGVDGECITKGLGDDPLKLEKCNVDAQKREELSTLGNEDKKRGTILAALGKAGVGEKCKYQKKGLPLVAKYWLSDECLPEEVDRVWKYYLIENSRTDDYDCVLPLNSEAKKVCTVKRQTVNTLQTRGWKDVRADKGWEANV